MNFLEAEDDGHGPVPMEVGAMKGKKGEKGKKGYGKGKSAARALGKSTRTTSTARTANTAKAVRKEKKEERKAKEKDKEKTRSQHQIRVSRALQVANGGPRRASVGKVARKLWRKFRVLPRVQWRRKQRQFKKSMTSRNHDGSSA